MKQKASNVEALVENINEYICYWRLNIHRFAIEYLGLDIKEFQQIALYLMDAPYTQELHNFIFFASRGLGKSWLVMVFCVCKCILFPGIKIKVASATVGQANKFLEKIHEIKKGRPNIEDEIEANGIRITKESGMITFRNGSSIESVVCSDSARGKTKQLDIYYMIKFKRRKI